MGAGKVDANRVIGRFQQELADMTLRAVVAEQALEDVRGELAQAQRVESGPEPPSEPELVEGAGDE